MDGENRPCEFPRTSREDGKDDENVGKGSGADYIIMKIPRIPNSGFGYS